MSDPSYALQVALYETLKADAAVAAFVAGRVYDQPPAAATYPYISLGEEQTLPSDGDGYSGSDTTLTLHVWSRATGFPEAKKIVGAIKAALGPQITIEAGTRIVELVFGSSRYIRDPDGLTSHGIVTVTALTEPV